MMSEQIVMRDSPDAAQYRTDLKGWVSRDGFYFGDGPTGERTARYAGCTHVPCDRCGTPTPKGYTQCRGCRDLTYIAKYEAMPRAEWDGEAMLYSEARDQYYSTPDEVAEAMEAFNRAVSGIVLSWSPGKTALALPDEGHNAEVRGGDSRPA